jgi:hypothetical protein
MKRPTGVWGHKLLWWHDRDRDPESPQLAGANHAAGALPGTVDDGLNHGATPVVDIEDGRYIFFCFPVDGI